MSLTKTNSADKGPKPRRKLLRWLLWGLLALILVFFIVAIWVWSERFNILEGQLKDLLAQEGIAAELNITQLSQTDLEATDITLSDQGKIFLKAKKVELQYQWRDLLDGKIETIMIKSPELDITIDAKGNPDLSFLSKVSGAEREGSSFPPDGIHIEHGLIDLTTPYGLLKTNFGGRIMSESEFDLTLDILPSQVNYGDVSANFEGPVKITQTGEHPEFELELIAHNWSYKELSGLNLKLGGQGQAKISDVGVAVTGNYDAWFDRFKGKAVGSGAGAFSWQGEVTIPRRDEGVLLADGKWRLNVSDVAMPDPAKRQKLARRLTLFESMSKAPVTSDFAAPVSRVLSDLLSGADAGGSGSVKKQKDATYVYLDEPLIWKNPKIGLTATSRPDTAFYDYQRAGETLALNFDASLRSHLPMKISGAHLEFKSTNGRNVKGTNVFTGDIVIPQTWSGKTASGRSLRLRPTTAKIDYQNTDDRFLSLNGKINYDGDIPGGYVTGLATSGRVKLALGDRTDIYFWPAAGGDVTMQAYEIEAPWIAKNVRLKLSDRNKGPFFTRRPGGGRLVTTMQNLQADLESIDGLRELHVTYAAADVSADISGTLQTWIINGKNVRMTSDTVPSLGTIMSAADSDMTVLLRPETTPEFTITTPEADVQTQIVEGTGLAVVVKGTPEHFKVDYENGYVKFKATDLPPVKMTGDVIFKDDIWQGKAVSFMDLADDMARDTPIDVTYSLKNGRGSADVSIPEIIFRPSAMQPQMFIPALRGKIAEVAGRADVRIHLEFEEGEPMTSSGTARLIDMNLGTLPGPLTGVNAELKFSSFFPLVSEGQQTVTIKSFDPGFPLPDGEVTFETVPDGVKIHSARWPMGSGFVSLDPTDWIYTAAENRMQLRIEDVSLGEFLGNIAGENFSATGNVNGLLPVVISGINVLVENGRLEVKDGGVIQYQSPQTNAASDQNEVAGYAFDALKEFHYKELEAIMNGPLDGTLILRLLFEGSNPNVLGGAVFKFNVKLEGELLNIARSFQLGGQIASEIEKAIQANSPLENVPQNATGDE